MPSLQPELLTIQSALQRVNAYLQSLPCHEISVQTKEDGSPVTNADITINTILQEHILKDFPDDGWLSEESPDNAIRLKKTRTWIVDPIDGTKPFVKGLPQYVISISLIDQGHPLIGTIFNPATKECFWGIKGQGATINGQPIHVRKTPTSPLTLLVNPWNVPKHVLKDWKQAVSYHTILGSIAYSMALMASGHVDGVINIGSQNEWDVAAAVCLIEEAGGIVLDRHDHPVSCNKPEPSVDGIIAGSPEALPYIQDLLTNISGLP